MAKVVSSSLITRSIIKNGKLSWSLIASRKKASSSSQACKKQEKISSSIYRQWKRSASITSELQKAYEIHAKQGIFPQKEAPNEKYRFSYRDGDHRWAWIFPKRKEKKLHHRKHDWSKRSWFLRTSSGKIIALCSHSSVGLERDPAKVEVAGSSPAGCTITILKSLTYLENLVFPDV